MIKRICVLDGQGGGIGSALIRALKGRYGERIEIWGLGTNAIAAAQMMKAGANRCATGENAVIRCLDQADLILGPISITWANAMLGELTPKMAEAVTPSTMVPQNPAASESGKRGPGRFRPRTPPPSGGGNRQRQNRGVNQPCVKPTPIC